MMREYVQRPVRSLSNIRTKLQGHVRCSALQCIWQTAELQRTGVRVTTTLMYLAHAGLASFYMRLDAPFNCDIRQINLQVAR